MARRFRRIRRPRAGRRRHRRHKKGGFRGNVSSEMRNRFTYVPRTRKCVLPMTMRLILPVHGTTPGTFGNEYVWRLNSIWQPLFTGGVTTAKRVLGYSALSAEYNTYKVYGCQISLEFTDPNQDGLFVGACIEPSASGQSIANNTIEDTDAREGFWTSGLNNTGAQKKYFKQYVPIHKIQGTTKTALQVDEASYAATMGSNPAETPYLRVAAAALAGTTGSLYVVVRLKYYTYLYNKIPEAMVTYTS